MPNPQNPELRRSEETLRPRPERGPDPQDFDEGATGPIPADNQPGNEPAEVQDKPPADAFAAALGIKSDRELEAEEQGDGAPSTTAKKGSARKASAKKAAAASGGGDLAKKATGAAKKASRTAMSSASPAEATAAPAKNAAVPPRPAAAGTTDQGDAAEQAAARTAGGSAAARSVAGSPTATSAPTGAAPKRPGAGEAVSMGSAGATSKAVSAGSVPPPGTEDAATAAAEHHHTMADDALPHDTGIVTPSGAPVTIRVLTYPARLWIQAAKTSGNAVLAYTRFVRRTGEKLIRRR